MRVTEGVGFPGCDDPRPHKGVSRRNPLGDVRRRGWLSPETPAPFSVLLAQDLLLTLALFLRAQIAVLLLQEPHRRPALFFKVPLVFYREKGWQKIRIWRGIKPDDAFQILIKRCVFMVGGRGVLLFMFLMYDVHGFKKSGLKKDRL